MSRVVVVDVFVDGPFTGATASVVLLDQPADEAWMMAVAAEMKHPETAFVDMSAESIGLRWFSAHREMDLVGSATMAAAHVLGGTQTFSTRSGDLTCTQHDGWISMDFPLDAPGETKIDASAALGDPSIVKTLAGVRHLLVELDSELAVRALHPDMAAVAALDCSGVAATAPADEPDVDFVSRWFGPGIGIPEAVNGSTHCMLAAYWANKLGTPQLTARQVSPRTGLFRMRVNGDRVVLQGRATTVLDGLLTA